MRADAIRCTRKLLRRLPVTADPPASTTLLGDWYANILFSRPQQLLVCVSERTLLPIVLPAKESQTLVPRLALAVGDVLLQLGVNSKLIEAEQNEMRTFAYARTQNRRVLGSLNDFMFMLTHDLNARPNASLTEHSLHLARTPCTPIGHRSPDRVVPELFKAGGAVPHVH